MERSSSSDSSYSDERNEDKPSLAKKDRLTVLPHSLYTTYPYNCLGLVLTHHSKEPDIFTGFLLSSNTVLTTAHSICLISN